MTGLSPEAPPQPATRGQHLLVVPILLTLGRTLAHNGRYSEASEALGRALAEPEDKPIGEVLLALVDALLAGGDREGALRATLEQGRTAPGEVLPALPRLTPLLRPATLRPIADLVTGEQWTAVVGDPAAPVPTRRRLLAFLVRARLALTDPASATALLDSAAGIVDGDQELLILRSDCQSRLRALDAAVGSLTAAAALPGEFTAEIELRLARLYEQLARPDDALRHLDAAERAGDGSAEPPALRALVLLQHDDLDGALRSFLEAERRAPDSVATTYAGACVHLAAHDYEEAKARADAGLTHHPGHSGLSFLRFQAIVETGEDAAGIERRLSRFLHRMPQPDLDEWVERCARVRRTDDPALHYFVAVLNQALRRPAEALRAADTALALLATPQAPAPVELPARRLRALLLEPLLPEESAAEYERAGQLAFDLGSPDLCAQLLTAARGLGELSQLSRWLLAESLQSTCYELAEPMKIDRERLRRALDVWEEAIGLELPTTDASWVYVTRARISLHYARLAPDPLSRVVEAAVWTQCFDALSVGTEASVFTFGAVAALLGIYGLRNELTWAATRPPLPPGQYPPTGDLLATAAANAGELDLMAAAVPLVEHDGDVNLMRETRARLEVLRGDGAAALVALDDVPPDERDRAFHVWWRAIANWLVGDLDALDETLTGAPSATSWEGISVWMHLLGGDPQRAAQIVAGLGDEQSWSTDATFEAALCRLAAGSADAAADEAIALSRAEQGRSFEDATHLPMLAGMLARRYPHAGAAFGRIAAAGAARLPDALWPLTPEADLAHLERIARSGRDEGWAEPARAALRARLAMSRRAWSDAIAGYRSLITHLDRFPEVESGLAWVLAEVRAEPDPLAELTELEAAVAELRGHPSRRTEFMPELTLGDLHLRAGRLDRAVALYGIVTGQPLTAGQHALAWARLHLVAVERGDREAADLLERALHDFRVDSRAPWFGLAATLGEVITAAETWQRLLAAWAPPAGETEGDRYLLHLTGRFHLALQLGVEGRDSESEAEYRAVLGEERRVYGDDGVNTLITLQRLAGVVAAQGRWDEAEAMNRTILAARTGSLGADDPATLEARQEVAWTLYNQGDLTAAEAEYRAVLEARRRVLGENDPATLETWHSLAGVLSNQDDLVAGEAEYRAVLAARRMVLGDNDAATVDTWQNLAYVVANQDRWAEAEPEYRAVADARRRTLGDDHAETARSRAELASILENLGRHREAAEEYRAVLAQHVKAYGADAPQTLAVQHQLAGALVKGGEPQEGAAEFRAVRDARLRVLGDDHPETVLSAYELAAVHHLLGDFAEAESGYRDVLVRERVIHGPEHPDTLITWHNLATTISEQGRWAEAEEAYREVLAIRRRLHGDADPATFEARSGLVKVLLAAGRWDAADAELTSFVAVATQAFGDEHPSVLAAGMDLAWLRFRQGRLAEAEEQFRSLAETHARAFGPDDPETLTARAERCSVLVEQGRFDEAIAELGEVFQARARVFGDDHPAAVSTRSWRADVMRVKGDYAAALVEQSAIAEALTRILGEDDEQTLIARYMVALNLQGAGRMTEAEAEFREVLERERRTLGDENPSTYDTWFRLAEVLAAQGRREEARAAFQTVLTARRNLLGDDDPATDEARSALAGLAD
ncbi:tetratricopeptide repeat protein [Asanoa sp. NPDC049573]|uniref:tetratricopeptide repeat protein n=1 Tax=Asanoa sp. NPDC049573 TaxID=3155396 RepID=UPI0034324685